MPYCFSRSSVKFQGHTGQIIADLTRIDRFRTATPVWIDWWIWCDAQGLKQHRAGALLFFKVICQISRSHGTNKITDFNPNWAFPDCISSFNSLIALQWCTKLGIVSKRCPIVFLGHPSNSKVTRAKWWFESNLSKITRLVAAIKSLRFALLAIDSLKY